jgi:hypothetical protein
MPVISRFLGIVIMMYWNDHSPPHFHAKYGSYEIVVTIGTGVVEGKFPKRALQHVIEWSETIGTLAVKANPQGALRRWSDDYDSTCDRGEVPQGLRG